MYHYFFFKFFKYIRFEGHSDEEHISETFKALKNKYYTPKGLFKEINIFGIKTKTYCMKSTAYYINISKDLNDEEPKFNAKDLGLLIPDKVENQNEIFNICTLYFGTIDDEYFIKSKKIENLAANSFNSVPISSIHILLLKLRFDYHIGSINKEVLAQKTIDCIKEKSIKEIMRSNSFSIDKQSTSHELGYFVDILFDIYTDTENGRILDLLKSYLNRLHRLFVSYKTIYSNVIKKDNSISLSGSFLIAKVFLKYTILTQDYRYASAAFFMLDTGKKIQRSNFKNLISNTLPLYRFGSPFKYPAWTLCYFLESLNLKIKVKTLLKDETSLYI